MPPPYRSSHQYNTTPDATSDPRQIEGWGLAEVAARMRATQREPVDPQAVMEVARLNRQLWTIIQANLVDPDCTVPLDTRNALLRLTKFIDKHTLGIMKKPEANDLGVLISINQEIARGLLAQPPSAAPTPPPASTKTPPKTPTTPSTPPPQHKRTDTRA